MRGWELGGEEEGEEELGFACSAVGGFRGPMVRLTGIWHEMRLGRISFYKK